MASGVVTLNLTVDGVAVSLAVPRNAHLARAFFSIYLDAVTMLDSGRSLQEIKDSFAIQTSHVDDET